MRPFRGSGVERWAQSGSAGRGSRPSPGTVLRTLLALVTGLVSQTAAASEPAAFFSGMLELSAPSSQEDAETFNLMIRGDGPFHNVRLRLLLDVAVTPRLTLFNQLLIDTTGTLEAGFLRAYLRYELLVTEGAEIHLQAGKLPTPFGTFGERSFSDQNPLISVPLMYHYFSSLRSNQIPADNADLLRHQGEGARGFTGFLGGGGATPFNGLPMVYDACWDVGLGILGSVGRLEYLVAVTQGTLSTPRAGGGDSNDGKQLAGRLGYVASPSLTLGVSYARGPYLDESLGRVLEEQGLRVEDFDQRILGLDLHYSVGHLRLIAEYADNRWQVPNISNLRGRPTALESYGSYIEVKYTLRPGLYAAARYDQITFSNIDDGSGMGVETPWDADVERLELGMGYRFNDQFAGKLIWQQNRRQAPAQVSEGFVGLQLVTAF